MTAKLACEVCNAHDIIGVCSSGLGPISVGYCAICLSMGGQPRWLMEATWEMCNGEVAEWVKGYRTIVDYRWVTWDQLFEGRNYEEEVASGKITFPDY
jgi:hypothetical protein